MFISSIRRDAINISARGMDLKNQSDVRIYWKTRALVLCTFKYNSAEIIIVIVIVIVIVIIIIIIIITVINSN